MIEEPPKISFIELWNNGKSIRRIPYNAHAPLPREKEEIRIGGYSMPHTERLFKIKGITHEWSREVIRFYVEDIS